MVGGGQLALPGIAPSVICKTYLSDPNRAITSDMAHVRDKGHEVVQKRAWIVLRTLKIRYPSVEKANSHEHRVKLLTR